LPWLSLLIIYLVWGSTYMAIRILVAEVPPLAAASLRFLVAGLTLGAVALRFDRARGWPSPRQWLDYGLIGVLFLGIGNGCVMWSEKRVPSGIAALLVASVPLWLTFLDGIRPGGRPWTLRVWVGVALGLGGVAIVARPSAAGSGQWLAVLALEIASLSWSIGALYSQSLKKQLPVFRAAAIEMLAGGAFLAAESTFAGEDLGAFAVASRGAWLGIGYLAVFGSLVGFTAFAYCLRELPASTVGTYAYVNPVVAVVLGRVFLGEPLSVGLLFGAISILGAVVLCARPPAPRGPRLEKNFDEAEMARPAELETAQAEEAAHP